MDSQQTNHKVKPMVYVAAVVSAISGVLCGYDIGGSGGTYVMAGFRKHFGWPIHSPEPTWVAEQQGWITAMFALGSIAGSLVSGHLTDRFGRKGAILMLTTIFTVGAALQLVPVNMDMLYAGRFTSGLGVGGLSMAATLYQSETAPTQIRGLVVSLQQLAINFGIVLSGSLNVGLQHWQEGWRFSYGGKAFFSLVLLGAMFFMPESPRWLFSQGKHKEADRALRVIRTDSEVEIEMTTIRQANQDRNLENEDGNTGGEQATWSDLFSGKELMWYRTSIGFGIQLFQQLCGINAVVYFAPIIFAKFLSPSGAIIANLAIAIAGFCSTLASLRLVDRLGRRVLLTIGGLGMGFFAGLFAFFAERTTSPSVLIALTALYVVNYSFSWGPLAWVVAAEVFPQHTRARAMTITTLANWLANFVIAKTVPLIILPRALDLWGTFMMFSAVCGLMTIFVLLCLPETNGVKLEKMEGVFHSFLEMPLRSRFWLSKN